VKTTLDTVSPSSFLFFLNDLSSSSFLLFHFAPLFLQDYLDFFFFFFENGTFFLILL